jgi:hypothetical protein
LSPAARETMASMRLSCSPRSTVPTRR